MTHRVRSCGCWGIEHTKTHGMSDTEIYHRYSAMRSRCLNKTNSRFKDYGGRGIKICDRWLHSFKCFYEDMNDGFKTRLTLDRIDVNGDYSPENCRWATAKEQSNNMRNNLRITYGGKTKTVAEWANIVGMKVDSFRCRHKRGWSLDRMFNQPMGRRTRSATESG
jgi:hypothetical protein